MICANCGKDHEQEYGPLIKRATLLAESLVDALETLATSAKKRGRPDLGPQVAILALMIAARRVAKLSDFYKVGEDGAHEPADVGELLRECVELAVGLDVDDTPYAPGPETPQ